MANSTARRSRTKPDKPRPDFPLFAHATGRWAKKINGRLHYFGPWDDPEGAEQRFKSFLAGDVDDNKPGSLTIKRLVNDFLNAKRRLVDTGELARCTLVGYKHTCKLIIQHFGRTARVADLKPAGFEAFRAFLSEGRGLVSLGNLVNRSKVVFNFAPEIDEHFRKNPVWYGRAFKKPEPRNVEAAAEVAKLENGERDFTAAEIRQLMKSAGQPLQAMIYLGINCGFGNTDCSRLPRKVLESAIKTGWINYPRPKTAKKRRCKLWPETIKACKAALADRAKRTSGEAAGLAFVTKYGGAWVKDSGPGNDDAIAKEFRKLCISCGVHRKGVAFYGLRRSFATVASESLDQVAVDCVMGHRDYTMSGRYRQRVSDARLEAVSDEVRKWLWKGSKRAK